MQIFARAAILATLFLVTGARAQDVTLTARDGSLELSGTMRAYDGAFYRVETDYGLLTLDAQGVVCAGPGCPDLTAFVAEAVIDAAPQVASGLLPALIRGHATEEGLVVKQAGGVFTLSEPASGRDVMRLGLRPGATDADMTLSRLDDPEGGRARVIALDGIVPLVAPGNPLRTLGLADLAAVLRGEITDWGALGGAEGLPIALHLPAAGGDLDRHLGDSLAGGAALVPGAIRHGDAADLASAVARDPLALGVGLVSRAGGARVLPLLGSCGAISRATPHALKSGDYPLPAPVFLHIPPRRPPLALRRFLAYLETPAAGGAIRGAGLVDLVPEARGLEAQGERLATAVAAAGTEIDLAELQRLAALMQATRRLSITFRFQDGSAELDSRSRANLRMLARRLEAGLLAGQEVLLVGFSDASGPAAVNRALALRRAETVRAALDGAVRLPRDSLPRIGIESFGEALPIACDDTEAGRRANRRVEVWLR